MLANDLQMNAILDLKSILLHATLVPGDTDTPGIDRQLPVKTDDGKILGFKAITIQASFSPMPPPSLIRRFLRRQPMCIMMRSCHGPRPVMIFPAT